MNMQDYYTPDEVKDILKIGRNKVYQLIHQPGFPVLKIGSHYRIPTDKFEIYMQHQIGKTIDLAEDEK